MGTQGGWCFSRHPKLKIVLWTLNKLRSIISLEIGASGLSGQTTKKWRQSVVRISMDGATKNLILNTVMQSGWRTRGQACTREVTLMKKQAMTVGMILTTM